MKDVDGFGFQIIFLILVLGVNLLLGILNQKSKNKMLFKDKEKRKEYSKLWRANNKNYFKEYNKKYWKKNKKTLFQKYKIWVEKNKGDIAKKQKIYYKNNKERLNKQSRDYYHEHKEKVKTLRKRWLKNHPDYNKEYMKEYRQKFPEKVKKQKKEDYKKHKKYYSIKSKEYGLNNSDRLKQYYREYGKKNREKKNKYIVDRLKLDKEFNISVRLRGRLRFILNYYTKTGKIMPSKEYGIDYKAIIEHLKPFPKDISKYHIDHIKPLCSFKFINSDGSTNKEEVRKAFAPRNHQWLLAKENRRKRRYDGSFEIAWKNRNNKSKN